MTGTMTFAGLDVHARSTHAAAIEVLTGELRRARFGAGSGDFARFENPRKLSSWLGLVPSLDQSGESRRQGAITKTGSGYARRLLVESSWHYLREPRIGVTVANRQQGQPAHVLQIDWRAQHRLYRLHARLRARGKPANVSTVADAHELACFLWTVATAD
jgi:transposase